MSYRDLRNLSEAMRALSYPQNISVEAFRTPNWECVEAVLRWLATRLEPDAVLPGSRHSLEQRRALVVASVRLFMSRANVRLNGRRVYGADGWAARELLKVAALLRGAQGAGAGARGEAAGGDAERDRDTHRYDVSGRLGEIKQARQLATEITGQGAFLYDLLAKETDNKAIREQALSRPLDLASLEAALRRALGALAARGLAARERIEGVSSGEAALDAKIERRRAELQRAEKRLHTVHKIKPAYQGELTALESEIEQLWEQYVLRYRCVEALKHQLSLLENAQAEAAEEQQAAIMQLIHKYEAEDVLGKLSDSDENESSDDRGSKDGTEAPQTRPATRPKTRLRINTAGAAAAEARRAFGSMAAGGGGGGGGARDSLDDIRDEDDSASDSDLSDQPVYGSGSREEAASRWSRRPRPATRTLAPDDDFADLIEDVEGGSGSGGDSLGSSSESELRLGSAARAAAAALPAGRLSVLSDNEF